MAGCASGSGQSDWVGECLGGPGGVAGTAGSRDLTGVVESAKNGGRTWRMLPPVFFG